MGESRKLKVWEKSHALAIDINALAKRIRGSTNAPLKNQIVRAAMSVPANIVEGRAHNSEKEFSRFISYAIGSAAEVEYHLLVARDIGAINEMDYLRVSTQLSEVRRMLYGLSKRLKLSALPLSSQPLPAGRPNQDS